MTFRARSCFAFFVLFLLLTSAGVVRAGSEDEVKALFARFVAAQNAHDLKEVGALLQDSAQFLWITRGAPIWGHDAAIKRFEALYQGWRRHPETNQSVCRLADANRSQDPVPGWLPAARQSQCRGSREGPSRVR